MMRLYYLLESLILLSSLSKEKRDGYEPAAFTQRMQSTISGFRSEKHGVRDILNTKTFRHEEAQKTSVPGRWSAGYSLLELTIWVRYSALRSEVVKQVAWRREARLAARSARMKPDLSSVSTTR